MPMISYEDEVWLKEVAEVTGGQNFTVRQLPIHLKRPGNSLVKLASRRFLECVGYEGIRQYRVKVWRVVQ